MYCPNCGHQNPNNINFCQNCGNNLKSINSQQNNDGRLKTKEEYMKEYHQTHPQIFVFYILSIIFDVAGFFVILFEITDLVSKRYLTSSDEESFVFNVVIGVLLFTVGAIFLIGAKTCEKKGLKDYENYYVLNYKSSNNRSVSQNINGWDCSKCGMTNPSNTSTCGNCGTSREKAVYRTINNNPSANEWKCPSCGRINQNYVGTCGCGARKP